MSIHKCKLCNKQTKNPKFCSRRCSASFSNKMNPKRKPEGKCKTCNVAINKSRKYCKKCYNEFSSTIDYTLEQVIYDKHHRSSAYALVRSRARSTEKAKNTKSCEICNYSKHTEVCHIKAISSFPLNTLLSEINGNDNIICLCPNCHWEFDNGLIKR
jgi:hypothetical protein